MKELDFNEQLLCLGRFRITAEFQSLVQVFSVKLRV